MATRRFSLAEELEAETRRLRMNATEKQNARPTRIENSEGASLRGADPFFVAQ